MEAIITIIGKDKSGIVAGVSSKISQLGLNIEDIAQTILGEHFTMMAVVSATEKQDFNFIRNELNELGEKLGVKINIQSTEIFKAMHNI